MAPRQQGLTAYFNGSSKKRSPSASASIQSPKRRNKLLSLENSSSRFGSCPLCNAHLPLHVLTEHAQACNGRQENGDSTKSSTAASRFGTCPLCESHLPLHLLMAHAQDCSGRETQDEKNLTKIDQMDDSKEASNASLPNNQASDDSSNDPPWWKQTPTKHKEIQNPILPTRKQPIPGLYLFEEFITNEEEDEILAQLDGTSCRHEFLPWKPSRFNGFSNGKRWGVHCNLRDRRVDEPQHAMPNFFHSILVPKLQRILPMMQCIPNEANAIDYHRKQGHWLKSHVDDRQLSKEPIANLSLAGDCYMTYTSKQGTEHRVLLKRRTLQVLTGKARYDHAHGIANQDLMSDRRVSVTMRESPLTKS